MLRRWILLLACLLVFAGGVAEAAELDYVRADAAARQSCGQAATGWQSPGFDDRSWTGIKGPPADGGTGCAATLYERWRFDVGPELAHLSSVSLHIRYSHGFAAYLNGVEVARRRLAPDAPAAALATEVHGPEADRVFIPLRPGLLRPSGNVLAIEVHPRTAGHQPMLAATLDGAEGPRLVRGPYLVWMTGHSATVVFDTDLPTVGEVKWGPSAAYGESAADPAPTLHHVFTLAGLASGTVYHYRAIARGVVSPPVAARGTSVAEAANVLDEPSAIDAGDASFHTLPRAGRPLSFIVYGDVRSGHDVHAQLDRALADEDPDLALENGDMVDRGDDEGDWDSFFDISGPLLRELPIFPTPGNHEYVPRSRGIAKFLAFFRQPLAGAGESLSTYYSFDAAGVHFVALDSHLYRSPRQLAWFAGDLKAARQAGAHAIFVYTHEGAYSSGLHGDNPICIRDYVPLMRRYGVAMLFEGHDHDYERGRVDGLDYLVTGGGGAELRNARCGVPGKRACASRVLDFINEHNYVRVDVMPSFFRVCPKRPDGTPLTECAELPIPGPTLTH